MRKVGAEEALKSVTTKTTIPDEGYVLYRNKLILGFTKEYVDLRLDTKYAARVEGKSSLARLGLSVHITAPTIHSGFDGCVRLEIVNHGPLPIRLRSGMSICQLIFEQTLGTPDKGYNGQFAGQKSEWHYRFDETCLYVSSISTTSLISQSFLETPAAIAGVVRSVLWMRTKF
jgi:deoxycytidine triphosphate deaminase